MAEEKAAAQHRLAAEGREWFGRIHRGPVLLQPQPLEPLRLSLNLPPDLHPQAGLGHPQALEAAAAAPLSPARSHLFTRAQPQPQPGQLAWRQGRQGGIAGQQRQRQGQLPLGGLGVGRAVLQAGGLDRQRPPACRRAHLHQQGLVEAPARPIRRLGGLAGDGGTGQRLSRFWAQGGEQAGEAAAFGGEVESELDLAASLGQGQQPARHREPHPRSGIGRVPAADLSTAEAGREGSARGHRLGVNFELPAMELAPVHLQKLRGLQAALSPLRPLQQGIHLRPAKAPRGRAGRLQQLAEAFQGLAGALGQPGFQQLEAVPPGWRPASRLQRLWGLRLLH